MRARPSVASRYKRAAAADALLVAAISRDARRPPASPDSRRLAPNVARTDPRKSPSATLARVPWGLGRARRSAADSSCATARLPGQTWLALRASRAARSAAAARRRASSCRLRAGR